MKKNLSVLKFALLVVVAPVVLYMAAFSGTLQLIRELNRLGSAEIVPELSSDTFHCPKGKPLSGGEVLFLLSGCEGVVSEGYTPKQEDAAASLALWTARVTARGPFRALLLAADAVERGFPEVRFTSLRFSLREERGKKAATVLMEMDLIALERDGKED